jgi:hypothetical protein
MLRLDIAGNASVNRLLVRSNREFDPTSHARPPGLVEEIHSGAEDVRANIAAEIRKLLAARVSFSTHYLAIDCPD